MADESLKSFNAELDPGVDSVEVGPPAQFLTMHDEYPYESVPRPPGSSAKKSADTSKTSLCATLRMQTAE